MSTEVKLPNFLVVGAQKCGTTAIYHHLRQHPQVFMPATKEPKFLSHSSELSASKGNTNPEDIIKSEGDYRNLFKGASNACAVGEASPNTMYFHKNTIPKINSLLGNPKIIITLREPVTRAYSAYRYLIRDGREARSFEQLLAIEDQLVQEEFEPLWHFRRVGCYSEQVLAMLTAFSDVMVILDGELKTDPGLSARICEFLEIDPFPKRVQSIERTNTSGVPRLPELHRFLNNGIPFDRSLRRFLPANSPLRRLHRRVSRWNLKPSPEIDSQTAASLRRYFKPDLLRLESLLNRSLANWYQ